MASRRSRGPAAGRGDWIIGGGHGGMSAENQARWRAESERSALAVCRCVEMMGVQYSSARRVGCRPSGALGRRAWNGLSEYICVDEALLSCILVDRIT